MDKQQWIVMLKYMSITWGLLGFLYNLLEAVGMMSGGDVLAYSLGGVIGGLLTGLFLFVLTFLTYYVGKWIWNLGQRYA